MSFTLIFRRANLLFFFFCIIFSSALKAQVTIISDSFDDGNITANPTWSNNTSAFTVNTSTPLVGTHSLRSNTGNTPSYIYTQYAVNTNLTSQNYTWNLTYRANTGSNPDELPFGAAITAGTNHWRFWIAADGTNATNCDGFYISHSAGNIKFCRKKNNSTWDITTYAISLNTTYSIKIFRRYDGYFDFYVDAGTAEATTIRWSGWATDVFNSGSSDIYMLLHANETSANRFQWDNAGLYSKSLTVAQLTNGVYTGDLEEGLTDIPVVGFSATAIGTVTLEDVKIQNTNTNSQGNFINLKLIKSVDNDYTTQGDNTVMTGITFSLNGSWIFIEDINTTLINATANFFLTLDNVNNNGGSPPSSIQFSMSCNNNCGVPYTNVVTTNAEKVNDFSFSTPTFTVLRVFKWKNTSIVGDFTDNWQNSSAWEPYRTDPSPTDVLEFSKGGTVSPLNIPSESVKKIVFKNNTVVNVTTSSLSNGSATLSIVGGSDDDFSIESGSTLNVSSTGNNLVISLPSATTAEIYGNLTLAGKSHQIYASDANTIQFKSGSIFTGGTGLLGNPFGNSVSNSVVFESGATLIDQAGVDYFTSSNVLNLNTGSTYKHAATNNASLNNKTFSNFEIGTGAIFYINANTLNILGDITGLGTLVFTSGVLNLGGNYTNTGALTAGTGTINYNGTNQNVKVATYANINFKSGGNKTLLGSILFAGSAAGTLTLDVGVKLIASAYTITANTAASTISINGHLSTTNTVALSGSTSATLRSTNSPTVTLGANSTIEYASTSTQAITARTDYANIIASGSGQKNAAAITVNGSIQIDNGVILSMASSLLTGSFTTSGSGIFRTTNTSTTPVPANLTWSFTFDANGGTQSIVAGNYTELTITGSGTKTARGNVSVTGNLNINASRTFTMGTYLLQSVGTTSGTGILRTDNTTSNPIPSNVTWTFTVLYNGASQTVVPGNYKGVSIAGSGTKTSYNTIEMDGVLNIATSNTLDIQTYLVNGISSTAGVGKLKTANTSTQPLPSGFSWSFTIEYYGTTGDQYVVPGNYTSLIVSGTRGANNVYLANNSTLYLSSAFTASATFAGGAYIVTGNTFIYNGSTQNLTSFTYNNLSIEGLGDKTAAGTINIGGNLHINSDRTLLMSTRQLASVGTTSGTGILRTSYTSSNALPSNKSWSFTVDYNSSSAQTVVAGSYTNLSITGTRNANNVTLINGGTINVSGVFNPAAVFSAGNYISTNNTIDFNGDVQDIPAFTYNNLTVSGAGNKTLTGNIQVNGLLNLNGKDLVLDNRTLTLNGNFSKTNANIIAGTCGNASGTILIIGSGTNLQFSLHPSANYLNNLTITRASGATLNSSLVINETLSLNQGPLVINDTLLFNAGNTPISRSAGTLEPSSNATFIFGDCVNTGSAIVLPDNLFSSLTCKNIVLNRANGITFGNQMLNITGEIKISSGILNTNNNLTLVSNAQGTARVDAITCNGCTIIGNVKAERFIPGGDGKRRWRLLSSPTNVSGFTPASDIIDDIIVTGVGGATKGFDESPNNNGSLKTYDENISGGPNNGWTYPSKIDTAYQTGRGLCVFVRGDRNVVDPFINWAPSNDATIDFTGSLTVGDFDFPVTYTSTGSSADGWNLVGNPYASTISWEAEDGWVANNMQSKIWLYNPVTGTYGTYDNNLAQGTNSCTQFIASGQAFLVKASANGSALTIKETAKVDSIPSNFFRKAISNVLRIKLVKDSLNSDESILYLSENGTGSINDPSDAQKFFNDEMNFYLRSRDGYNLAINEHPIPNGPDTIKASIFSYSGANIWAGEYTISFTGIESFANNIDVYFEDIYASKVINLRDVSTYTFTITTDANSVGNNRFRIILGKNNNPTGVDETKAGNNFNVYPNPFDHYVSIKVGKNVVGKSVEYAVYNQFGQKILQQDIHLSSNTFNINTEELSAGLYFVTLKSEAFVETRKLLKK